MTSSVSSLQGQRHLLPSKVDRRLLTALITPRTKKMGRETFNLTGHLSGRGLPWVFFCPLEMVVEASSLPRI